LKISVELNVLEIENL